MGEVLKLVIHEQIKKAIVASLVTAFTLVAIGLWVWLVLIAAR